MKIKERKNLHGLLLVNKPTGLTSHDVISRVRRILGTKEVGHSGTLDPLASGLMVLLIGEATKLSSYITEGDKSYRVELQLGIETDTLDITGQVQKTTPVNIKSDQVISAGLALADEYNLPIPLYSAKKIDGQKLYEYARNNEHVEIPFKKMKFWDIEFLNGASPALENKYSFNLACSKGSFIRSWVKLLGENLQVGATMTALSRLSSHDFSLNNAIDLESVMKMPDLEQQTELLVSALVPINQALNGVKTIKISGQDQVLMSNGQISHGLRSRLIVMFNPDFDQFIQVISADTGLLMALVGLEPERGFCLKRVFRYE